MRRTIFITGLLSFISSTVLADQGYNNPNVNSRLASSAEFPSENSFNNNGHTASPKNSTAKPTKKKPKKPTASKAVSKK